jgi:hypothetical protein
MVAVSGGLIFAGYQLLVYGWSQVNHGNAGFFDILWPGRYKGNPLDGPTKASTISYGQGVTNPLGQGVASGVISQGTANQDVSGNATVGLGTGTFKVFDGLTGKGK